MKTIFLKEEQMNYIKAEENSPVTKILNSLKEDDVYIPLNDFEFTKKLLSKQYQKTVNNFSDDITSIPLDKVFNKYSKLLTICQKKEKDIRPQLEKICYNTIVSLFNIPEDEIYLKCELVDSIDDGIEFHVTPNTDEDYEYESVNAIEVEKKEIEKRKLINALSIGIAMSIFEKSNKIYNNDIFELDEELPYFYSKLMKLNDYLLFMNNVKITDKEHHQGGFTKVILGNDMKMSCIEVKAVTFPILLVETIKGLMELVSSNGLPDNLEYAKSVVDKSDILSYEPCNMRIGRELWSLFTLGEDINSKIIPDFFSKLINIDSEEFIDLTNELIHNTKQGKRAIKELIDDVKHESDYNSFYDDIMQKQSEKSILENEYFLEGEL